MGAKEEYFVRTVSKPAPIASDESFSFIEANSPGEALVEQAIRYLHPFGFWAIYVYESADAYHKSQEPLVKIRDPLRKQPWPRER